MKEILSQMIEGATLWRGLSRDRGKMKVFVSSILVSEFARVIHQRTAASKVVSEFARATEFVSSI